MTSHVLEAVKSLFPPTFWQNVHDRDYVSNSEPNSPVEDVLEGATSEAAGSSSNTSVWPRPALFAPDAGGTIVFSPIRIEGPPHVGKKRKRGARVSGNPRSQAGNAATSKCHKQPASSKLNSAQQTTSKEQRAVMRREDLASRTTSEKPIVIRGSDSEDSDLDYRTSIVETTSGERSRMLENGSVGAETSKVSPKMLVTKQSMSSSQTGHDCLSPSAALTRLSLSRRPGTRPNVTISKTSKRIRSRPRPIHQGISSLSSSTTSPQRKSLSLRPLWQIVADELQARSDRLKSSQIQAKPDRTNLLRPRRSAATCAQAKIRAQYEFQDPAEVQGPQMGRKNSVAHAPRDVAQMHAWCNTMQLMDRSRLIACNFYDCDALLGSVRNLVEHTRLVHCAARDTSGKPYICLDRDCLQHGWHMDDPLRFPHPQRLMAHFYLCHVEGPGLNRSCPVESCDYRFTKNDVEAAEAHLGTHDEGRALRPLFGQRRREAPRKKPPLLQIVPGIDFEKYPHWSQYTPWIMSDPPTVRKIRSGLLSVRLVDPLQAEMAELACLEPTRCEGAASNGTDDFDWDIFGQAEYEDEPVMYFGPSLPDPWDVLHHPFLPKSGPLDKPPTKLERPSMRTLEQILQQQQQHCHAS